MTLILSVFAVFSILELGVLVQFYLQKAKNLNFSFSRLFALGLGTICIIFYISGFLQIHLSRALVMTAAFTFSLPFFLDARLKNQALRNIDLYIQGLRKSPKIFLIIFTAFLVVLFMLTFSKAIWGYDAYERWLAKGRTFWVDGGISRENAKIYDPADDHNLWPFAISWLYYVNGDSEEIWVRIIPFIAFLAIIFEFKKHINKSFLSAFNWCNNQKRIIILSTIFGICCFYKKRRPPCTYRLHRTFANFHSEFNCKI